MIQIITLFLHKIQNNVDFQGLTAVKQTQSFIDN